METDCTAANPISTGRVPYADRTGPATMSPSGMPRPQIVLLAAIAFGRIAGGIRSVQIEWIEGLQMPFATRSRGRQRRARSAHVEWQQPERRGLKRHGESDQPQPVNALGQKPEGEDVPTKRPGTEGREESAGDLRVGPEALDDSTGTAAKKPPGRVPGDEQRDPDPEQRLMNEEAQPGRIPRDSSASGVAAPRGTKRMTIRNETT